MNFEDLQKTWQNQEESRRVLIDADLLLNEVRRNQNHLSTTLFWRDFREVGAATVMIFFFTRQGLRSHDWTDFMLAAICFAVGLFILVDRLVQRKKLPASADTLKDCIQASIAQVSHQTWLLKNVLWWYILPLSGGLLISAVVADLREGLTQAQLASGLLRESVFLFLLSWAVYSLNQGAVRKSLEPRRRELEKVLEELD